MFDYWATCINTDLKELLSSEEETSNKLHIMLLMEALRHYSKIPW